MKNKKGNLKIVIITIVVILIICTISTICLMVYAGNGYLAFNNSYSKVINLIDKEMKNYNKLIDKKEDKYTIKAIADMKVELVDKNIEDDHVDKIVELINNTQLEYNGELDTQNKYMSNNITLKNGGNEVNAKIYIKEKIIYLISDEIFGKYISSEIKEDLWKGVNNKEANSIENIEYIYNLVKKDIGKEIIKKENITQEKVKIIINDKEEDVNKISIKIDQKLINNATINILTKLKNDKKAITSLMNIYNNSNKDNSFYEAKTEDDIKEMLEKSIENSKLNLEKIRKNQEQEDETNLNDMYINLYTKGILNKLVQFEIASKDEAQIKIQINEIKKGNIDVKFITKKLGYSSESKQYESIYSIKAEYTDEEYKLNLNLNDEEIGKMGVNISGEIQKNRKIDVPSFNNAVNIKDLTEIEINEIFENVFKVAEKFGLDSL